MESATSPASARDTASSKGSPKPTAARLTKAERKKAAIAKSNSPVSAKTTKPANKISATAATTAPAAAESKRNPLFAHLEEKTYPPTTEDAPAGLHPTVRTLGLQFAEFKICGSNARCIAMLNAFKQVIEDYQTPAQTTLSRHLPTHLSPQIAFLVRMRPLSTTMGNAIRFLKNYITSIDIDTPDSDAKAQIIDKIDEFVRDRITMADKVIVQHGLQKIQCGDVILTYGCSSVVKQLLLTAHAQQIAFQVVVVDSRPLLEGHKLLHDLVAAGIPCTYTYLNAVSYAMKQVSKVFIGTHAVLSNGTLLSRTGTAIVAMTAHNRNIPVIVCSETYKFTEKVQLDSFVWNELGNSHDVIRSATQPTLPNPAAPLQNWESIAQLKVLNPMYDITPSEYLTMAITEVGMLPFTSVPVVLREYRI